MNQATLWEAYVDWISRDQGIPPQHLIAEGLHALDWRAEGAVHHLFDPRTGRSSHRWQTITVHHDSAAVADALSTAAYCASADEIASLVRKLDGLIVWATDYSGKESRWESAIRPAGAKLLRMG